MINITERAASEVRRAMTDGKFPDGTVLRVGVLAGGCSGYQYKFAFDKEFDETKDHLTEQHGLKVVVDKRSDLHLDGTTIDFYEGLDRRGFTFENPNVSKSCGCGTSFSV